MTIGERIAFERKELGLSQGALGERMGVSRQSIYKWEPDAALPEIEKLVKLSRERIYPGLGVAYNPEENFAGHVANEIYYYPRGMDPAGWEY